MLARSVLAFALLHFAAAKPVADAPKSPSELSRRGAPVQVEGFTITPVDKRSVPNDGVDGSDITGDITGSQLSRRGAPVQIDGFTITPVDKRGIATDGVEELDSTADITKRSEMNELEKRRRGPNGCGSDCVSSCGKKGNGPWVPLTFPHGYNNAIKAFCDWASKSPTGAPNIIPSGERHAGIISTVDVENGKTPAGKSYPEIKAGYLDMEIHNKSPNDYTVKADDCKEYLASLATPSNPCYGPGHDDTMGGTYQVGANQITFHAIPNYNKN